MALLVKTGQELLHALNGLSACSLPSSLLGLVVLQVAEGLDHEARARAQCSCILR